MTGLNFYPANAVISIVFFVLGVSTATADTETHACGESLSKRVIGDVRIVRQQIFDTSKPEENKSLYRLANRYHILTRDSTVRSQLLFKEGDVYDPRLLEESERILRENSFLWDAKVTSECKKPGVVDVLVVTRDVWTLTPGLSLSRAGGQNELSIDINDSNLFGTGADLRFEYEDDIDRESFSVSFRDRQLGKSRIALNTLFSDNDDGHRVVVSAGRPFFALNTRWSVAGTLVDDERIETLYALGDEVADFQQETSFVSAQYGWSKGLQKGWVRRWMLGAAYDENLFDVATTTALPDAVPVDRKFVYPFIGFALLQDKFETSKNLDQIDRTEDLFLGTRFSARLGWSSTGFGAEEDALIFSMDAGTAFGSRSKSLLVLESGLRGRLEDNSLRNSVLRTGARFYRNQSEKRLFFATITADWGHELDLDNPLRLGGDTGLRGYPARYQNGSSRALITLEQRYFTNWYPFRLFRVGGAIFADAGRTWGDNPVGGPSRGWLSDIGVGLRLGSTRVGSSRVVHIDLAFPLNRDDSIDNVQLILSGRRSF